MFYRNIETRALLRTNGSFKERITVPILSRRYEMAQSHPNLTSFQSCSSQLQLPSFTTGQGVRVSGLITIAAPHSVNLEPKKVKLVFMRARVMPHSVDTLNLAEKHLSPLGSGSSACEADLGLELSPKRVGGQPSSLGPAAVPDDRARPDSGVVPGSPSCPLVCTVAPVKSEWWNPWRVCHHPRSSG